MTSRDEMLDRWIEASMIRNFKAKWKPITLEREEIYESVRPDKPSDSYRGRRLPEDVLVTEFIRLKPLGEGDYSRREFSVGREIVTEEPHYIIDRTRGIERRIYPSDEAYKQWLNIFPPERVMTSPPRRIDLVFENDYEIWILEAKADPDKLEEAVGQVLVDRTLFQQDNISHKPIRLGIICKECSHHIEDTCEELGIAVFEKTSNSFRTIY